MPAFRKIICCLIFFIASIYYLQAQTCDTAAFQNEYWFNEAPESYASKVVADANGNNFILTDGVFVYEPYQSAQDVIITKTNKRGTILWAKRYGFSKTDEIDDIISTPDGGLICVGYSTSYSGTNDGEGWYFKINANGNIVWSKALGKAYSRFTKIVQLKNGDYALLGSMLYDYKVDEYGNLRESNISHAVILTISPGGDTRWIKEFHTTMDYEQPANILALADGNILYQGASFILGRTSPDGWVGSLIKFNITDGSIIWQELPSDFSISAKELPNGDIRTYFYTNDSWMLLSQYDKDGKIEWGKKLKLNTDFNYIYHIDNTSINSDEDYFIVNKQYGKTNQPILFKLKDTSAVDWARTYSNYHSRASGFYLVNPYTFYYNNQFLVCASQKNDDSIPFLADLYLIQADGTGKTPCSSDYPLIVTGKQNTSPSLLYNGFTFVTFGGKPDTVGVYARSFPAFQSVECYLTTCCRDTVIKKSAEICSGTSYTLPDGQVVNKTDLYTSVLHKLMGCDSIIFTNLYVKPPLKVSLGGDTCFSNSSSITYKLSYAPNTVQYLWQNGSTDSFYTATIPGNYSVKVNDNCTTATDSVIIYKDCALPVYIPNAFTPNGDGLNDVFRIPDMKNQKLLSFSIFNRYGKKIFFTTDASKGWDGKLNGTAQQTGNFVYYIIYADIKKDIHTLKGNVLLLR